jgi:Putative addiction module component
MNRDPIESQLAEEQKAELDRRLAEDEAAPDDVVTWEEVKARALARTHDRGPATNQPIQSGDDLANDLIEHNPNFRALLEKSLASGREPFPFADPED